MMFSSMKYKRTLARPFVFHGGEKGIRTLVGLPPNGFQDRLVMTTSISLRIKLPYMTTSNNIA